MIFQLVDFARLMTITKFTISISLPNILFYIIRYVPIIKFDIGVFVHMYMYMYLSAYMWIYILQSFILYIHTYIHTVVDGWDGVAVVKIHHQHLNK